MRPRGRTVFLAERLYPQPAVGIAAAAFREVCRLEPVQDRADGLHVRIEPLEGSPSNAIDEFLSYLLSASLELHLASEG